MFQLRGWSSPLVKSLDDFKAPNMHFNALLAESLLAMRGTCWWWGGRERLRKAHAKLRLSSTFSTLLAESLLALVLALADTASGTRLRLHAAKTMPATACGRL
eukprot:6071322-Alexandrium_andersonii.AAC.1